MTKKPQKSNKKSSPLMRFVKVMAIIVVALLLSILLLVVYIRHTESKSDQAKKVDLLAMEDAIESASQVINRQLAINGSVDKYCEYTSEEFSKGTLYCYVAYSASGTFPSDFTNGEMVSNFNMVLTDMSYIGLISEAQGTTVTSNEGSLYYIGGLKINNNTYCRVDINGQDYTYRNVEDRGKYSVGVQCMAYPFNNPVFKLVE